MRHVLVFLILGTVACWALGDQLLLVRRAAAQDVEEAVDEVEEEQPAEGQRPTAEAPAKKGWSGPGFYYNVFKIAASWLFFLLWVHTADWVSRDGREMKLEYLKWNSIVFGPFIAAYVLHWLIPFYWLGFPLLVAAYVTPLTLYVRHRNPKVELHRTVFTPEHLRFWFAEHLAPFGVKMQKEKPDPHTTGPPVILEAAGAASDRDDRAHLALARQSSGFTDARRLLADGLYRRSDAIMLDYGQNGVAVQHMVDGVWHEADPVDRESGDPVLEALKFLCGLNPEDRRSHQEGTFLAKYLSEKYSATLTSQGTETGERVMMKFEGKKSHFASYDDLGMRPKMQEQFKELLGQEKGFVLFAAPPGTGMRSTMTVALRCTDRFMRELVTIEDEANRYEEIENVMPVLYRRAQGQTPDQILDDVFHKEPNVAVIRDLVNGPTVRIMCQQVEHKRLLIGSIRAKDSVEALLRVLALKVPPAELARAITAVLSQRLVRKLCEHCKEAYTPTPEVLQQLRIPQGRVEAFYRPPQENPEQEVCAHCAGIGYLGRTAIFELLVVDATVRKVLAANPKLDLLRQAAKRAGIRSFQEEGVVLVAKGVTSLPELMRVVKQ